MKVYDSIYIEIVGKGKTSGYVVRTNWRDKPDSKDEVWGSDEAILVDKESLQEHVATEVDKLKQ